MSVSDRTRTARLRAVAIMAGLLSLVGSGYAVFPRHADLRAFDPAAMAHSETTMWRHYYERRYLSLFADLYDNSRAKKIFREQISSVASRAQLEGAIDFCREGDMLVVCKLDRLARSVRDLVRIIDTQGRWAPHLEHEF
jgi:hypothetical protein